MNTQVVVKTVELRKTTKNPQGHIKSDVTVTFEISSPLGSLLIAVPVQQSQGLDHGVDDARRLLSDWAQSVSGAAMQR